MSTITGFSELTLNGSTRLVNDSILRLTNDYWQSGSAFTENAIALPTDASFSTFFAFQITNSAGMGDEDGPGGDGITFTIQSVDNNIPNIFMDHSVTIEFDTFNNALVDNNSPDTDNNNGNHIGIFTNGNWQTQDGFQSLDFRLNNGNIYYVWIDYQGETDNLEVRISDANLRPNEANLQHTIEIPSVLNDSKAFVGFTSFTGGATGVHKILNWEFTNSYVPVSPLSLTTTDVTVIEGKDDKAIVNLNLNGNSTSPITVSYTITPDTALIGKDYNPVQLTGELTIPTGSTQTSLEIPILNDFLQEADETFKITFSNAIGATLTNTEAIVTITDTLVSSKTAILPSKVENLTLKGLSNLKGTGNANNNRIRGNNGNNNLFGGAGDDRLLGLAGNDTLQGGAGDDILNGGAGNDQYLFKTNAPFDLQALGSDFIANFVRGSDKIVLSKTTFNKITGTQLTDLAIVNSDDKAAINKAHIVYSRESGNLFYNPNGSEAYFGNGGEFAVLGNMPNTLAASDFILIA